MQEESHAEEGTLVSNKASDKTVDGFIVADLTGLYSDLLVTPAPLELGETPSAVQNGVEGGWGLMGRDL